VIGLIIDEMFPTAAARVLRDQYGRDARHVAEVGLRATDDAAIARHARTDGRAVVTENVADFADEEGLVLVVVLKRNLPSGRAQAAALADVLDRWIETNPDPYVGHHWPK
jgi:serine/threonine protein kinase HipA of HipAB toxin-antitoxin module